MFGSTLTVIVGAIVLFYHSEIGRSLAERQEIIRRVVRWPSRKASEVSAHLLVVVTGLIYFLGGIASAIRIALG